LCMRKWTNKNALSSCLIGEHSATKHKKDKRTGKKRILRREKKERTGERFLRVLVPFGNNTGHTHRNKAKGVANDQRRKKWSGRRRSSQSLRNTIAFLWYPRKRLKGYQRIRKREGGREVARRMLMIGLKMVKTRSCLVFIRTDKRRMTA